MKSLSRMATALLIGLAITLFAACSGESDDAGGRPDMVSVPAPIESVEILVMESFPVQYSLHVVSGLSNGCVEFEGYRIEREGEIITVTVTNLKPADESLMCTEEYRTVTTNIPLGSAREYEPATSYTVLVNGVAAVFVTDDENPGPGPINATVGRPFQLKPGQTALVGPVGLNLEFVEVVEDSRCARDVTCIQAGRARILINVSSPGDILGFGEKELTLEAGNTDPASDTVSTGSGEFLIELTALDPYPETAGQDLSPYYTATLVVTQTAG